MHIGQLELYVSPKDEPVVRTKPAHPSTKDVELVIEVGNEAHIAISQQHFPAIFDAIGRHVLDQGVIHAQIGDDGVNYVEVFTGPDVETVVHLNDQTMRSETARV